MNYTINPDSPLKHLLNITLEVNVKDKSFIDFKLPIWRPGRYEAANYAKNIQKICFYNQEGNKLNYQKLSASIWRVETNGNKIKVEYRYYAHQLDAGNSWYAEDQLYINFVNCLLYVEEYMGNEHAVTLNLPTDYKIACGLKKKGKTLLANNYHELADSPMISSNTLEELKYEVGGVPFSVWLQGKNSLDRDRVVEDFKKFSQHQLDVMGEFPFKEYHFLNQLTSYKHYHGVEHGNSTVICIGPSSELSTEALYSEFAGVSSHELYHAWNILKIRPAELFPYDFGKPAIFPTGYVAEGFTTYYGDLFLVRSDVFDGSWYFNELNKLFQRHFHNGGRLNNSVIDSSYDLWIDGYVPGTPHKKCSIYVEGAMIALTLDLLIRKETHSEKSLDSVMRVLWNDFAKKSKGYTLEDIQIVVESEIGHLLTEYFNDYVYGAKDKTELIDDLICNAGCRLAINDNPNFLEKELGLKIAKIESDWVIQLIEEGSIGEDYFSIKDKVIKINGKEVTEELLKEVSDNVLNFEIERNSERRNMKVSCQGKSYYKKYTIEKIKNPSAEQKDFYSKWLNQEF